MKSILYEFEHQEEAKTIKYIIEAFPDFKTNEVVLKPKEAFKKNKDNTYEITNLIVSRGQKSFTGISPEVSAICKKIQEDYFEKVILANTDWLKIDAEVKEANLPQIKELWCR